MKKNTTTFSQQSANVNETDTIDTKDPTQKTIPQNDNSIFPEISLINNPPTSEKLNDPENENLQLQTILETYLYVNKQSFNKSFFDSPFSENTSKFIELFYLLTLH